MNHPSKQLAEYLETGAKPSDAVASWARFIVYKMAVDVLDETSREARKRKLNLINPAVRPVVEAEARRVFEMRKK